MVNKFKLMNRKPFCILPIIFYGFAFLIFGCTGSPLENNIDSTVNKTIVGSVSLLGNDSPEGVYIWLEDTDLNTFTDENGKFTLELPKSNSEKKNLESGIFKLFYYVANYKITSSTVVVDKGEFLASNGDLNSKGELTGTKHMVKLLRIKTEVSPSTVNASFSGLIQVSVALQATQDSVAVVLPKVLEGASTLIFERIGSGDPIILNESSNFVLLKSKIGREEEIFEYGFTLTSGMLPEGEYRLVPYFLIEQDNMPEKLIASIGSEVNKFGPEFLQIPFKREGGQFVIF